MRSYPYVVRIFQKGELTLSLGLLEPRYILEIMKLLHIGLCVKVIKNLGGLSCLVNLTLLRQVP